MSRRMPLVVAGITFAGLLAYSIGLAQTGPQGGPTGKDLAIGDFAPLFDLPNTDGKNHALLDCVRQDKKAVAVVFFCNHCPVAKAYQDRLIQLQKEYKDKGVQLILISSNDTSSQPEDSFDKMKELAKQKSFPFPYLYDESQVVATRYGAKVTPHVFLFDKDLKLQYRGAIDDDQEEPKTHHLKDAIEAVVAGKKPAKQETRQFGCSIKWKKQAAAK